MQGSIKLKGWDEFMIVLRDERRSVPPFPTIGGRMDPCPAGRGKECPPFAALRESFCSQERASPCRAALNPKGGTTYRLSFETI